MPAKLHRDHQVVQHHERGEVGLVQDLVDGEEVCLGVARPVELGRGPMHEDPPERLGRRQTYLNTAAAADLRGRVGEEVSFGGITFRRYRGGLGFGVPTDKAYFYPEGVEGLFEIYFAPADTFETVNTLGLPLYARMIPDRDRDEWVRLEIESNPLPICTRPQVLRSARRT